MIVSYHNHTHRCHHASGSERDYIEAAIAAGYREIGFSDHAPMVFDGDYYSNFRMDFDGYDDYIKTLSALREEYKDRISVRIGLEVEYYPAYFSRLLERLKGSGVEYMILGQHFTRNEHDGVRSVNGHDDPELLAEYADQLIEGMKTGVFTYVAHPDVYFHSGDRGEYKMQMLRICRCAKSLGIPLEVNFLGLSEHRTYPCTEYLDALAEVGCDVVLGCDAHSTAAVYQPETEATALKLLSARGIAPTENIRLIDPFFR